jgi:hypothetical protein
LKDTVKEKNKKQSCDWKREKQEHYNVTGEDKKGSETGGRGKEMWGLGDLEQSAVYGSQRQRKPAHGLPSPPHLPRETRNVAEVGGEARHETRPLRTTQAARPQANFWGGKRADPLDIGN